MSFELHFEPLPAEDIPAAYAIESEVFPPDEAASLEAFRYRQKVAPSLFLGTYKTAPRTLVGYVASTRSSSTSLTHASMSLHEPSGSSVCIHSVATLPSLQRRGIALRILKEYTERLRSEAGVERVLLICHEELRRLYEKAGFEWVGKSSVQHGTREWFEMKKDILPVGTAEGLPSGVSSEALAAALAPKPNKNGQAGTVKALGGVGSLVDGVEKTNKLKVVCLSPTCGSVIIGKKAATLYEAPSVQLEPGSPPVLLPVVPSVGTASQWWHLPSPMSFDNVSYSRATPSLSNPSEPRLKLLACAECELGPIGYSIEGKSDAYVWTERVGYRV